MPNIDDAWFQRQVSCLKQKTAFFSNQTLNCGEIKLDLDHRPKAESENSVAAASIVAQAVRELWIDEESKKLRLDLRRLSVNEAISHSDADSFAKLSFLKRRRP